MRDFVARYVLKVPRQERAWQTIEALVEATELVLLEEGWEGVNTNRIAERAGVSIGTLYQYFAHKEALVGLMVERFVGAQQQVFEDLIWERSAARSMDQEGFDLEHMIHEVIQVLMRTHTTRPELSRALFMQIPSTTRLGVVTIWTARSRAMVEYALRVEGVVLREGIDHALAAHILVTSLHGVIFSSIMDDWEMMRDERFLEELKQLVWRYIRP